MRAIGKLLPIFMLTGCLIFSLVFVSNAFRVFVTDRQPATIYEIPLYPQAGKVTYTSSEKSKVCQKASFETTDDPGKVQTFYFDILLRNGELVKRNWLGDGVFYPEANPVSFYRKAWGGMQQLDVHTSSEANRTLVGIDLCKKP